MIKFSCPHCGKSISAPDHFAGKRGKCPGCQQMLAIPSTQSTTDFEVLPEDEAPAKPAAAAIQSQPSRKPKEEYLEALPADEEPERPRRRRRRRDYDDDDYDDEPRDRDRYSASSGTRVGKTGYAVCYNCGADRASRVGFTWWGGIIGPAILCHVKCGRCGTVYNGRSGKSNTTGIVLYFVVTFVLAVGLLICIGIAGAAAN